MKLVTSFLRLVRWPNLLFIVITQVLFNWCVLKVKLATPLSFFSNINFNLLVLASVLIAAAGYIINDYFDLNIDSVNKPAKLVVDKVIRRRSAIALHILLSFAGIVISFYIDFHSHTYWLGLVNLLCVFLLFGYSISLKKKLLIGNVLISILTAWVLLVVFFCYKNAFFSNAVVGDGKNLAINTSITRIAILFAGFAFIISLVREVIKDMEDMEGDTRYGCRTMPIVWGIPAAKVFTGVWIVVLVGALSIVQFYVLQFGWWFSALYCFVLIILPLLLILQRLYHAQAPKDYHWLSSAVKFVMFTGILSMIFFKIYA